MKADSPNSLIDTQSLRSSAGQDVGNDLTGKPTRPDFPVLTCIVPAYNEADNLTRLVPMIDSVLRPLAKSYSILIVDDGSSDDTSAAAVALAARYPVRLLQFSRN